MNTYVPNPQGVSIFQDGVQALLLSQPFYGTLLMKLRHVPNQCGTAYVDGRNLGYDPDFFAAFDTDEAQFVVAHEVNHCAWLHLDRIKHYIDTGIGPDGQPLDMQLFNQALDYPNNASLVESGIGKPPKGFPLCLDVHRFPATMTPEEVYCELRKNPPQGGKGGPPQALDDHRPKQPGNGPPAPGQPAEPGGIDGADVMQAANVAKAMGGKLPAGIERLLGEIKKPSASPWKRLRRAVTSSLSGYDASTWRRLQRRYIVRGIGMPGRIAQGAGKVGVVVDTSGSIGKEMLTLFGSHMAAIIDDARPELLRVYWTDAKVHRADDVKNGTQLRSLLAKPVPGGGGTDMREGVRAAEEDGCDVIVVLTDGYTPFCRSKKLVVWAITTQVVSPHGETIHIG